MGTKSVPVPVLRGMGLRYFRNYPNKMCIHIFGFHSAILDNNPFKRTRFQSQTLLKLKNASRRLREGL